MPKFIMATRLDVGALRSPPELERLEQEVMKRVREHCPQVDWGASFAVLGPYDYLDVFDAPDIDSAVKVATLVRSFGHAMTEVWPAVEWKQFKELVRELPAHRPPRQTRE